MLLQRRMVKMANTRKFKRANKLIADERVWLVGETVHYKYYTVVGFHDTYDVIYDKRKKTYNCTCRNLRPTTCSHIEAVKLYQGIFEDETDETTTNQ